MVGDDLASDRLPRCWLYCTSTAGGTKSHFISLHRLSNGLYRSSAIMRHHGQREGTLHKGARASAVPGELWAHSPRWQRPLHTCHPIHWQPYSGYDNPSCKAPVQQMIGRAALCTQAGCHWASCHVQAFIKQAGTQSAPGGRRGLLAIVSLQLLSCYINARSERRPTKLHIVLHSAGSGGFAQHCRPWQY